jgi:hypothetical protein
VKEHAMTRKTNDNEPPSRAPRPGEDGAHLPPDLARAEVDQAKKVETDLHAQQQGQPEVLQMRENPNRRRKKKGESAK